MSKIKSELKHIKTAEQSEKEKKIQHDFCCQ